MECKDCVAGQTEAREKLYSAIAELVYCDVDGINELLCGLTGNHNPGNIIRFDVLDRHNAARKIIEAAGLDPAVWGLCKTCGGTGVME